MIESDRPAFGEALAILAETLGEELSATKVRGYFEAMRDLDIEVVIDAMRYCLGHCKFFPKPVELRDAAEGSVEDQAALAWTWMLRALEDVGTYQSVDFGDPVLHAVIDALGGWHEAWRIERLDPRDQGFKRAEFVRLYRAMATRAGDRAALPLFGQHALGNAKNGHHAWSGMLAIGPDGRRASRPHPLPGARPTPEFPPGEPDSDPPSTESTQ